ncbi:MAG TPA: PfkB family carbohydrate kinase [Thermoleophilia bacterium]|nr:PfkB family carbohydrate kinase [Thermoleophilia bacterium]
MSDRPQLSRTPVVAIIGMATADYLYVLDDYPKADSVTPALEHQIVVGGLAGRAAIAARRLGGATRLLAACGTGVHAEVLMAGLDAEGVDCTWVAYDQPSQHSAVILARGDATRTIIWLPQPMADARMIERLPEFLDGVDVALLDSTDEALATAALDECERRGVTTVIDTGSGRPWTASLLGRADHVIAPEKYVLRETGHPAERAALELWGGSCRAVFGVTQGPKGGVFTTGKGPECLERWDAAPVTAVDSCGAGDTFHGAYAWAVAKGLSPAECFATAAWSAGLKISQLGNAGIPTLDQLEDARRSSRLGKRA